MLREQRGCPVAVAAKKGERLRGAAQEPTAASGGRRFAQEPVGGGACVRVRMRMRMRAYASRRRVVVVVAFGAYIDISHALRM